MAKNELRVIDEQCDFVRASGNKNDPKIGGLFVSDADLDRVMNGLSDFLVKNRRVVAEQNINWKG